MQQEYLHKQVGGSGGKGGLTGSVFVQARSRVTCTSTQVGDGGGWAGVFAASWLGRLASVQQAPTHGLLHPLPLRSYQTHSLTRWLQGVDCGEITLVLHVRPCEGLVRQVRAQRPSTSSCLLRRLMQCRRQPPGMACQPRLRLACTGRDPASQCAHHRPRPPLPQVDGTIEKRFAKKEVTYPMEVRAWALPCLPPAAW